jgi:hypothetical protein
MEALSQPGQEALDLAFGVFRRQALQPHGGGVNDHFGFTRQPQIQHPALHRREAERAAG